MANTSFILDQLNPPQQEAVTFGNGPLLVLAGPGSGKTRVLTHRTAWLIKEKKIDPGNILLLTFTNKAASEMKKRIIKILSSEDGGVENINFPFAGTFHSFCAKILRSDGAAIGIDKSYSIYDTDDQIGAIKAAMEDINISPTQTKPSSVRGTISQAKNELISALEYPQYAQGHYQTTVARIYLTYQRLLKDYKALDFDDLLFETVKLFQTNKPILKKYQDQFQYILIDEYQDTNQAQYILARLLASGWQNLCAVGDASQAIYGFRGANFRNINNLKNDFPNIKVINLEQNYRSTQIILGAANELIRRNTGHTVLNLWTKNNKGDLITIYEAQNETDEAFFVLRKIQEELASKAERSLSNFAILYRTNAQSRVIEETLLHANIPYTLVGGVRFYERKEIKDCLAYLRLISNPKDQISEKRVTKLGKRRLAKFEEAKKEIDPKKIETLAILDKIIEATSYLDLFDPKDESDYARLENLKELRSVANSFKDLDDFLQNVALMEEEGRSSRRKDATSNITLMTVHSAKGTEFPIVFIVGMEENLFPHSKSVLEKDSLEEERRLCYVAMTRAKEKLYLCYSKKRLYFGQRISNSVSRFVADIPEDLLNYLAPKENIITKKVDYWE